MSRSRIPEKLRSRVAEKARRRCGYCLSAESIVGAIMDLDHLVPAALGGETVEDNLWLACSACNKLKLDRIVAPDPETGIPVLLFNPRRQAWIDHFVWTDGDTRITGTTPTGRATVEALQLNRAVLVTARALWVEVGWHPPKD
jgi:hypothetical protein